MVMVKKLSLLSILLIPFLGALHALAAQEIVIPLNEFNYTVAQKMKVPLFIDTSQPVDVLDRIEKPIVRGVIDFIMVSVALHKAQRSYKVRATLAPNSFRGKVNVENGLCDVYAYWSFGGSDKVIRSDPYLPVGMMEKGLYVSEDNKTALNARTIEDIKKLRGGTVQTWEYDLKALKKINPAEIILPPKKELLYKMIKKGRLDFTFAALTTMPEMEFQIMEMTLLPIKGFKIIFPDTFHYFVSKKTANAHEVVADINKGLSLLHKEGYIKQILLKNGVIHKDAQTWTNLLKD